MQVPQAAAESTAPQHTLRPPVYMLRLTSLSGAEPGLWFSEGSESDLGLMRLFVNNQ